MESLCWTCARCRDLPDPAGCIKTRTMWEKLPEGIEVATKQGSRYDHEYDRPYVSRKVKRCPQYTRTSRGATGIIERPNRTKKIFTQAEKEEMARQIYEKGATYAMVSVTFGMDKNTLIRILKQEGLYRKQRQGRKAK